MPETNSSQIFISYSSQDQQAAEQVVSALKDKGYSVWRDKERLKGGMLWPFELGQAISQSRAVVLIWSSQSFSSYFVREEWGIAFAFKRPIIPLQLDDTELPASLIAKHGIPMAPGWELSLKEAIDSAVCYPDTAAENRMLERLAPIGKFAGDTYREGFVKTLPCLGFSVPEELKFRSYLDWMVYIHQKLPVKGLAWNNLIDVKISQVYVRMKGYVNSSLRDPTMEEEKTAK